jgi:hypothetical protein
MNRIFLFATIGVVAVLVVAAFWAGHAFATTGCFSDTNGHWAETYICWLKDHGITFGYGDGTYRPDNPITRGEMAAMLQRQAQVPPSIGAIFITPGNGDWLKWLATNDITFDNYANETRVRKATTGDTFISIQPSVPTVLYDRELQLVAVDFCYSATTNAYLYYVEIDTFSDTNGSASNTIQAYDSTTRTDSGCRYYTLPAPVTLTVVNGVEFFIQIVWTAVGSSDFFSIGRTTFVFQPTDTLAISSPSLMGNVVPLSIKDTTTKIPSTAAP